MPLVKIKLAHGSNDEPFVGKLSDHLTQVVAKVLHVEENPDAHLTADQVEVEVTTVGPQDRNYKDIGITIETNDYRERVKRLSTYEAEIRWSVQAFLIVCGLPWSISVWVRASPGAYGESPRPHHH